MHTAWISYVRKGVHKQSAIILIIFTALGAFALIATQIDEQSFEERMIIGVLWLIPSCLTLLCMLLQTKLSEERREQTAELISPLYVFMTVILLFLINQGYFFEIEANLNTRQLQTLVLLVQYYVTLSFMACSYFPHLAVRFFILLAIVGGKLSRNEADEDNKDKDIIVSFTMIAMISFIFELTFYFNTRVKLLLFMEIKSSQRQQQQLLNLLDTVPDNVLICKNGQGDERPKAFYANSFIEAFFQEKIKTYCSGKKRVPNPYVRKSRRQAKGVEPKHCEAEQRKIFSALQASQSDSEGFSNIAEENCV